MHLWLRLGIIQVNLASALALHKRSFSTDLCAAPRKGLKYVSSRARITHYFPRKNLQPSTNSRNRL